MLLVPSLSFGYVWDTSIFCEGLDKESNPTDYRTYALQFMDNRYVSATYYSSSIYIPGGTPLKTIGYAFTQTESEIEWVYKYPDGNFINRYILDRKNLSLTTNFITVSTKKVLSDKYECEIFNHIGSYSRQEINKVFMNFQKEKVRDYVRRYGNKI